MIIRRGPLDPALELTPAERVGRYLLFARLALVVVMFAVMVMPWHRVFRRDVPCSEQGQVAVQEDVEAEYITTCTGVVHPDGRAWMLPCLLIIFFGASIVAFRDQSRVASIITALLTLGVVLAFYTPIHANFVAHPRVGTVGEPTCHVYSIVELWPQRAFYYFFFASIVGSVIEVITHCVLFVRDWIEDRQATKLSS